MHMYACISSYIYIYIYIFIHTSYIQLLFSITHRITGEHGAHGGAGLLLRNDTDTHNTTNNST